MSRPRIVHASPRETSRLFAVAFNGYFQRVCRLHRELLGDDIDLAIVSFAVALAAIEGLMRNPAARQEFASIDAVVGDRQRGIAPLAIAVATGIPRETVRRKMNQLVEQQILARREDGAYIVRPGVPQAAPYPEFLERWTAETLRFFTECIEQGIFEIQDPSC
jgi:hypothetical protein